MFWGPRWAARELLSMCRDQGRNNRRKYNVIVDPKILEILLVLSGENSDSRIYPVDL
jgi:hypothetical protein